MAGFNADINLQVRGTQQVLTEIQKVEKEIDRLQKKSAFNLGGGMSDARRQANILKTDKKRLQIQLEYEKAEKRILKSYNTRQRANRFRLAQEKKVTAELQRQARLEERAAQQKKKNAANRAQNVALGVGFPLLFGGGPGSVIGGGLGALGGGFGGSVIASGLGAQFDLLIRSATELGQALNPLTADLDKVVEASGAAGTSLGSVVSELESLGLSTAAYTTALQILENQIGEDGVKALQEFGDGTADLGREVQKLLTDVSVVIAEQLTPAVKGIVGALANANLERQGSRLAQTDTPIGQQLQDIRSRIQSGDITPAQGLEEQRQLLIKFNDERARGVDDAARAEKLLDAQVQASLASYEAQNDALRSRQEQEEKTTKEKEKQAELDKKAADRAAKAAAREAERARREEERLQKQIQGRVVDAAATQELIRLDNLESQARLDRDKFAQIEIEAEKQLLALAQQRQKALIGITDERLRAAIGADFEAKADRIRNNRDNQKAELVTTNGRTADNQVRSLTNQLELTQALTEEEKRRVKLRQDLATLDRNDAGLADGDVERLKEATIALSEGEAAAERYNQVLSQTEEIAGALSNNVLNGIRAVVEGTATAEEAFASFLNTIVDLLLKAAAEQIAAYIAIGIARQFAGMGSPEMGAGGGEVNGKGTLGPNYGIPQREVGGLTMANMPYVVGEKGPELFVPGKTGTVIPADIFEATRAAISGGAPAGGDSDAFAQNSIALGNSSAITKENSLVREMGMRENEPIDVRYDSTVINDVSYVSEEQFQMGIKGAIAQSKAAMFRDLKNKPRARSGIGI